MRVCHWGSKPLPGNGRSPQISSEQNVKREARGATPSFFQCGLSMNEYREVLNLLDDVIEEAANISGAIQCGEKVRHALKVALARVLGKPDLEHGSLEECLRVARSDVRARRTTIVLVLRSLAIPSVVPSGSERHAVELFEAACPDWFKYLDYDPKEQTFEKWKILVALQGRIEHECARVFDAGGLLREIEARKQDVLKIMSGKLLSEYCKPFGFDGIRTEVQTVFSLLSATLQADDSQLGNSINDVRRHLTDFEDRHRDDRNFFAKRYVTRFVREVSRALEDYDRESSSRFAADIILRMSTSELAAKRYPLLEAGRTVLVTVPFENPGPGTVQDLVARISVDTDYAATNDLIHFGDVAPGGFSLSFPVLIVVPVSELDVLIDLSWATRAHPDRVNLNLSIRLTAQDPNVDWAALAKTDSYSTEVAEGKEFVGRKEKVSVVLNRLGTVRMQSTYITGQKRIGKTSLAYAVRDALESDPRYSEYRVLYLEWGDYARKDAEDTVVALGTEVSRFLTSNLSVPIAQTPADFRGTLAPLIRVSRALLAEKPDRRYVIMLDEFDEIHPDMYRYGSLAEAVFSNLRTLSSQKNIAFILVGGERMPFVIAAQGDQLNKFVREGLDYFNRNEEWVDYQELVEGPTKHSLRWQPSAVNRVFELTNGHPYYTKLVCARILRNAVADRDSDITRLEVDKAAHAVTAGLDTNAFAHYWKDGIQAGKEEEEAISLMRQRVLAGLARAVRDNESPTLENITKHARTFGLEVHEVPAVLQEFCRRGILKESFGVYSCTVPLFSQWLCEVGATRLVVDTFGDQIADALRRAEEEAYVTSQELVSLVSNWDAYRGRKIGADDVRAWLEQVGTKRDQRLLFQILECLRFVSEAEVRKMLRTAYGMLAAHVKPLVKSRRSDRRRDILVVYVDGEAKSGQYYASKFAEENDISSDCVMNADQFTRKASAYEAKAGVVVDAVVVVDDIIGTGKSLSDNLTRFAAENTEFMQQRNAMLAVVALLASVKGEQRVRRVLGEFAFSADLRVCEILASKHFAFSEELGLWKERGDYDRAKALCIETGTRVYKKQPLGFGEQGLLVIFPVTCPNNSLPILHSGSKSAHPWRPLFPRPIN